MSARVEMEGLNELIQELTNAPDHIRAEGLQILREEVIGTATEASALAHQHDHTGRLARSLRTDFPSGTILAGLVQFTAPHGHLQFGTKARETGRGANRGRGLDWMKGFVDIVTRRRARMYGLLREMLVRRGFQVSA